VRAPNPPVRRNIARLTVFLCAFLVFPSLFARPQQFAKADRDYAQEMLKNVAADVQKYYYDPKLHGVDWDTNVRETKTKIAAADSMNSAVSEIAALLDILNDSHTRFSPPPRVNSHDYGFKMQVIGDHCFVTRVRPDSDAAKKGLKPGDEVLAVNDHPVSRETFWRISYIYKTLRPQSGLRLTLADETGHPRQLEVIAKITTSTVVTYYQHQGINQYVRDRDDWEHSLRTRYFEKGEDLLVVKFPQFAFSAGEADDILAKMRKHKGVVLDLRGNPGGFTDTLDRLLGGMFQYDQKICDRVGRDSTKPVVATGRHHDAFTGRFVVLIDSQSASASEVFARVIQLEKRGFVVGDQQRWHGHGVKVLSP
jgi:carboxyl-terminal processing protease